MTAKTSIPLPSLVVKGIRRSLSVGVASCAKRIAIATRSRIPDNLLDRLSLLSPRTWFGILVSQTQSDFHAFDASVLAASLAAAVIPLIFLAHFYRHHGTIRQREFLWRAVMPVSLLSPWNMAVVAEFSQQCRTLATALSNYWYGRVEALPSAVFAREEFMRLGRLTEHRRYDVYWPPNMFADATNIQGTEPSRIQHAILLLPGYGISHLAYSEVACRLANAGMVVVSASMEPLRIAHRHLGADLLSMRRIMNRVQDGNSYKWHLLGHSAGAFGAMYLYDQLHRTRIEKQDTKGDIFCGKLVLWGCAAMLGMSTNLSHMDVKRENHGDKSILLVQATNDSIVKLMERNQDAFDRQFPASLTATHWIQGGTHHGFASYQPTWPGSPEMESVVPYSDQQEEACQETIEFLCHVEN
jgi:hypothetical protein